MENKDTGRENMQKEGKRHLDGCKVNVDCSNIFTWRSPTSCSFEAGPLQGQIHYECYLFIGNNYQHWYMLIKPVEEANKTSHGSLKPLAGPRKLFEVP